LAGYIAIVYLTLHLPPFAGIAFLDAFGDLDYQDKLPAFVYYDNLGPSEDYVAEAASHEVIS